MTTEPISALNFVQVEDERTSGQLEATGSQIQSPPSSTRPVVPPRRASSQIGSPGSRRHSSLSATNLTSPPRSPPLSPLPAFVPAKKCGSQSETSPTPSNTSIPFADDDERYVEPEEMTGNAQATGSQLTTMTGSAPVQSGKDQVTESAKMTEKEQMAGPDSPTEPGPPKVTGNTSPTGSDLAKATPLLAITHPSVESDPEIPNQEESARSKPPSPRPSPPRSPSHSPGKGVSIISGKSVSGWL